MWNAVFLFYCIFDPLFFSGRFAANFFSLKVEKKNQVSKWVENLKKKKKKIMPISKAMRVIFWDTLFFLFGLICQLCPFVMDGGLYLTVGMATKIWNYF